MSVLKESKRDYEQLDVDIRRLLRRLPKGSIKKRNLRGHIYYYLQKREGRKVVHKYIGKEVPEELERQLQERSELKAELRNVQQALNFLRKIK